MNKNLKNLVYAALFAALIFAATRFVSIPAGPGYIHIGDAFIYICASVLPTPFAMAAAAIGGALSDLTFGYVAYILPTAIIKAACACAFTSKKQNLLCVRNFIAVFICYFITVGGYAIAEKIMYGNEFAFWGSVIPNSIQAGASAVIYIAAAFVFDRIGLKKRFNG